jgi:hypothetical protein
VLSYLQHNVPLTSQLSINFWKVGVNSSGELPEVECAKARRRNPFRDSSSVRDGLPGNRHGGVELDEGPSARTFFQYAAEPNR